MQLETFELIDDAFMGLVAVECGLRMVDVEDTNTEEWEDVMDRGQYWWME